MTALPEDVVANLSRENVRLQAELRAAQDRQTATAEILKVIASSPSDVQPVFEAIADSAKRLIGGFSTTVLRFIGDELHLAAYTPTNAAADDALKASFSRRLEEFPTFATARPYSSPTPNPKRSRPPTESWGDCEVFAACCSRR